MNNLYLCTPFMEKKKTYLWMEKNRDLKPRNLKSDTLKQQFLEKQATVNLATELIVKKSAVDYYSMKVPFNSI